MEKIYELCPSLKNVFEHTDRIDAIVRMCIAHVLNGNAYTGLYETAIEYLRTGFHKNKILCVTVFSDNKVIRVIVSSGANCYSEELKKIAYSLELK